MLRCFAALAALSVIVAGCTPVRPWQRGKLASPVMEQGFGEEGFAAPYRSKVMESRTGGGLPASAPGGGCGCTQ